MYTTSNQAYDSTQEGLEQQAQRPRLCDRVKECIGSAVRQEMRDIVRRQMRNETSLTGARVDVIGWFCG